MKKRTKVAIVIDQLLPGGVQKAAIQEAVNLKKLGFETKLLILMRKGFEKRNQYLLGNLEHEFLSDRYPKFLQKSFKIPIFKFLSTLHLVSPILAPLKVRRHEFDILISHGTTTSITTWTLNRFRKIPYIAIIHDPMVYILQKVYSKTALKLLFPLLKPLSTLLEKNFIKSSALCLVDSNVHVKYIKEKYKITPQTLYLGINPQSSTPQTLGNKIISFGRWDKEKNLTILLDLAKIIPMASFVIAGTWSNKKDLESFKKEITKRNLSNVSLITKYQEKDLAKISSQGRLWIHTHFEAFSLSALEAASFGLPIIIPKKSGITELFRNGVHGFFPKKLAPEELKKLIMPLLNNERKAWEMGNKAAAVVRENYTPQIRAKLLATDIYKIISSKTRKIVALEIGHIGETGIAGGDLLLAEMTKHLNIPLNLKVIIPQNNTSHWKQYKINTELIPIKMSIFDKYIGPWGVFATYLIRIIKSTLIIFRFKSPFILYSSTGIFPDVTPAFLTKLIKRDILWIARIHHLSPPPSKRPGIYWINLGSHILENLSAKMIKAKADNIIVLNNNLKNELQNKDFNPNKMVVLGGGVDYEQISKTKPFKSTSFDAVFLGRLHYSKGVLDLTPIWQKVVDKQPDAKLGIIGTGPKEIINAIQKQIKEASLTKNIVLLNFLPQKKVWKILRSSSVFLFTDHEAGFGLAVAEAMAAGVPIVGWDIGVLGTVFKKGFVKVQTYNYDSFASNILNVLTEQNLYTQLSTEAKNEAKNMDWAITSKKFTKILNLT